LAYEGIQHYLHIPPILDIMQNTSLLLKYVDVDLLDTLANLNLSVMRKKHYILPSLWKVSIGQNSDKMGFL